MRVVTITKGRRLAPKACSVAIGRDRQGDAGRRERVAQEEAKCVSERDDGAEDGAETGDSLYAEISRPIAERHTER